MLGKLSVALLIVAAPALASEPSSKDIQVDESGQAYRIKKVCQTVEVAGSFIPRKSCVTRKILVKKVEPQGQETAGGPIAGENQAAKAPEE